jgi:hypothetical protein
MRGIIGKSGGCGVPVTVVQFPLELFTGHPPGIPDHVQCRAGKGADRREPEMPGKVIEEIHEGEGDREVDVAEEADHFIEGDRPIGADGYRRRASSCREAGR